MVIGRIKEKDRKEVLNCEKGLVSDVSRNVVPDKVSLDRERQVSLNIYIAHFFLLSSELEQRVRDTFLFLSYI